MSDTPIFDRLQAEYVEVERWRYPLITVDFPSEYLGGRWHIPEWTR